MAQTGQFGRALALVPRAAEQESQQGLLTLIAVSQAQSGDLAGSFETLDKIDLPRHRDQVLSTLAAEQSRSASFSAALETLERMREPGSRDRALADVLALQAQAGDFAGARRGLARIENEEVRAWTQARFSALLAEAGHIDKALANARALEPELPRNEAFRMLVGVLIQSKKFTRAVKVADFIQDTRIRALTLKGLVDAQVEAGLVDEALMTARRIQNPQFRSFALLSIADGEPVDGDRADRLYLEVESVLKTANEPWMQKEILSALSASTVRRGQAALALKIAERIATEGDRVLAKIRVAEFLAVNGGFARALEIVQDFTGHQAREQGRMFLAQHLIAEKQFSKVLAVVRSDQNPSERAEVLRHLALALH